MSTPTQRIADGKGRSARLVLLFGAVLTVVAGVVGTILALAWGFYQHQTMQAAPQATGTGANGTPTGLYRPFEPLAALTQPHTQIEVALAVAGVAAIVCGVALFHLLRLQRSGVAVATALGATRLSPGDPDLSFEERRYLHILDEVATAAGQPIPTAFVMRGEQGINAFAAGTPDTEPAIAVTQGALLDLDRDELAGVVAHEMAHILHEDTRIAVRLMAAVFGLVFLTIMGRVLFDIGRLGRRTGNRNSEGGKLVALAFLVGLALLIFGWLGTLGGRLLQASVSREREFMADAQAARLTGDPSGIANALKKIHAMGTLGRITHLKAEEARHMFLSHASGKTRGGWFSTHPPLVERIQALEPGYMPDSP